MVPVTKLRANPFQERHSFGELDTLVASIKRHGFWGNLLGRQRKDGMIEIAFGERRLRAAKQIGLKELPVLIEDLSDEDMAEICTAENSTQEVVSYIERAEHILKLQKKWGVTLVEMGKRFGISASEVQRMTHLAEVSPAVKADIRAGRITHSVVYDAIRAGGERLVQTAKINHMTSDEVRNIKKSLDKHKDNPEITRKLLDGEISPIDLEIQSISRKFMSSEQMASKLMKECSRYYEVVRLLERVWNSGEISETSKKLLAAQLELNEKAMGRLNQKLLG